jgi:hypothetical protein
LRSCSCKTSASGWGWGGACKEISKKNDIFSCKWYYHIYLEVLEQLKQQIAGEIAPFWWVGLVQLNRSFPSFRATSAPILDSLDYC